MSKLQYQYSLVLPFSKKEVILKDFSVLDLWNIQKTLINKNYSDIYRLFWRLLESCSVGSEKVNYNLFDFVYALAVIRCFSISPVLQFKTQNKEKITVDIQTFLEKLKIFDSFVNANCFMFTNLEKNPEELQKNFSDLILIKHGDVFLSKKEIDELPVKEALSLEEKINNFKEEMKNRFILFHLNETLCYSVEPTPISMLNFLIHLYTDNFERLIDEVYALMINCGWGCEELETFSPAEKNIFDAKLLQTKMKLNEMRNKSETGESNFTL